MERIANLIQTKLPNYKECAFYAYNMPYNHQWWEKKYENWEKFLSGTPFTDLRNKYGSVPLTRQMIIDLFKQQNYYDGFLCAMVWGNIGANIAGVARYRHIFSQNTKLDIQKSVEGAIRELRRDNVKAAYLSLSNNGTGKIKFVGESFYTKILYFVGASVYVPSKKPKPLILDGVMHSVYDEIMLRLKENKPTNAIDLYDDYCSKMEELRELLFLPTAGYVEALLFCPGIRDYIFH